MVLIVVSETESVLVVRKRTKLFFHGFQKGDHLRRTFQGQQSSHKTKNVALGGGIQLNGLLKGLSCLPKLLLFKVDLSQGSFGVRLVWSIARLFLNSIC